MKTTEKISLKKVRLSLVLWVIFLLVIMTEIFVLYNYLYLPLKKRGEPVISTSKPPIEINKKAQSGLESWMEQQKIYTLPKYNLKTATSGRENPFEEYK